MGVNNFRDVAVTEGCCGGTGSEGDYRALSHIKMSASDFGCGSQSSPCPHLEDGCDVILAIEYSMPQQVSVEDLVNQLLGRRLVLQVSDLPSKLQGEAAGLSALYVWHPLRAKFLICQ